MISYRRWLLDQALERAKPLMRGRVLDVGGKRKSRRGTFTPPMEQVTEWKYLNSDPSTDPDYCCSAEAIPLPDGAVDVVVMTEVLEYLPEPARVVAEVRRVLAPQGVALVSVPFLVAVHGDGHADRARLTEVGLRQLFGQAGFSRVDVEPQGALGAVVHDLLHVVLGYAHPQPAGIGAKGGRWALRGLAPGFRLLDRLTRAQGRYVNTGYFLIVHR